MSLKVLYIDAVYPPEWLRKKQSDSKLHLLEFQEYRQWIIGQRIYLSDYISQNLRTSGFDCEEIIVNDPMFIDKLDHFLKDKPLKKIKKKRNIKERIKELLQISPLELYRNAKGSFQKKRDRVVVKAYEYFQPDIIFVREPTGIDTYFWNSFRHRSLVVALIGSNTSHPHRWLSHNFDVIFSLTNEYRNFFNVQGIPSFLFSFGVDERVYRELLTITNKTYDVTFVGLLGSGVQVNKSNLMEELAKRFDFKWWGPNNVDASVFPQLYNSYQGVTSGIEMLKIYRQSKIVVNDYVDTSNGVAVNLRLYEVINTGSFLLTRYAENLSQIFVPGMLNTYKDAEECISRINYFLANDEEREKAAAYATKWALENLSYKHKISHIAEILSEQFNRRYVKSGNNLK